MIRLLTALGAALCLAACSGGGGMSAGDSQTMGPGTNVPGPTSQAVNFATFTEKLVVTQPETTEPVTVTGVQFVFPTEGDVSAFAAVAPGP